MTNTPLTKQDLLQRLKEQDEAHKQRRADIMARVKSLEARKKFVAELKAWLARRKLTTTDLLAMYRELQPKRADRPVKSKNPLQPPKRRSAAEQLVEAMREARLVEIHPLAGRDLVARLGFSRGSYTHIINSAIAAGLLRKGNKLKDRPGYTYVDAVTGETEGGKILNRPVKYQGHGDPVFCAAIRKARIAKGWDMAAAGKKLGVSGSTISNWESGRYTPKEEARQKTVKVYGLPEDLGAAATAAAKAREGLKGRAPAANGAATA